MNATINIFGSLRVQQHGAKLTPGHGLESDENLMTASRNILRGRRARPESRSSRRYNLLRPCTSLTFIHISTDAISSDSSYRRQNSSTESFPQNPGMSRPGRRRREFLYSVSASCSSSSDIFRTRNEIRHTNGAQCARVSIRPFAKRNRSEDNVIYRPERWSPSCSLNYFPRTMPKLQTRCTRRTGK